MVFDFLNCEVVFGILLMGVMIFVFIIVNFFLDMFYDYLISMLV